MRRIPLVRLLLAHVTGPDLRRISDPDLVSQVFHPLNEPLTVARGLHADQHRRRQLLIKHFGVSAGMHQLPFPVIPGLAVQPTHLLPAGMEITSYNHHRRLLSSQRLCPQTKTTGVPNRAFTLIQSILRVLCEGRVPQMPAVTNSGLGAIENLCQRYPEIHSPTVTSDLAPHPKLVA